MMGSNQWLPGAEAGNQNGNGLKEGTRGEILFG